MDFRRRLGASDEHIPKWICEERATTPPPKRHAALRVALKLAWDFVAQSVEYRWGYTPSFAPRPRPISAQRMYSYFGDTTLDSAIVNGPAQLLAAIRGVNRINHHRGVLGARFDQLVPIPSKHQFATGELPLLQRDRHVDVALRQVLSFFQ